MTVLVNEVFEPVTDLSVIATIARLIYQDETHDLAVVIDLADTPAALRHWSRRVASLVSVWSHETSSHYHTRVYACGEDQLDERAKQGRDEKWAVIAPLLDPEYPGQIFVRGELGRLVTKRASELGIQRKTIYRLYRYWFYGQVRNSLLNNYSAVGVADRKYDPSSSRAKTYVSRRSHCAFQDAQCG
jgi:hypothetical protein